MLTCIHRGLGLCRQCQRDYDIDPEAYRDYGQHPEGIARWEALQAEMATDLAADLAAEAAYQRQEELAQATGNLAAQPPVNDDEIPF